MPMNIYRNRFKSLAREIGKIEDVSIISHKQRVEWGETAFVFYPKPHLVVGAPDYYRKLRKFQAATKATQREWLGEHFDVPVPLDEAEEGPFVVRPKRHHGGKGFKVVDTKEEAREQIPEDGYASKLFERRRECRAIFCGGVHTSTLEKRFDGERPYNVDADQDQPWNKAYRDDIVFWTRGQDLVGYNDPLNNTSFFEDAASFFEEYPFDIAAIDVGVNRDEYAVFELNLAPRITVESSLEPLREQFEELSHE